ncbi:MAG: UvrD-helicase domain-containing protein [Bacillota bacterium]
MKKIIKASAGTGKTYRLSLEYLASLIKGVDFKEIIVLTFTKKATAEIRERIFLHLETLIDNSRDDYKIIDNLKNIYPDIEIRKNRLEKIHKKMLLEPEKVHIYTIDSFSNRIFSQSIAPYLGIYNYEIIDENENEVFIDNILRKILNNEKYYSSLEEFLYQNAGRNLENYTDLIKLIVDNYWKFILVDNKKRKKLPVENITDLFDKTVEIMREVAELKGEELENKYFISGSRQLLNSYLKCQKEEKKLSLLLKNKDMLFDKSWWNGSQLRGKKKAPFKRELNDKYREFRENLAAHIFNDEVIGFEEELFSAAEQILDLYDAEKLKNPRFTHADISSYTYKYLFDPALKLIDSDGISEYFIDLLDSDYKALFIDEFQDTSILQWKILKPLIDRAEYFIAVGDEKQSIYGWRGGEKKLFADLENIIDGDVETLADCYRSDKNIIELVNRFFSSIDVENWEYSGVNSAADSYGHSSMIVGGKAAEFDTSTRTFEGLAEDKQKEVEKMNSAVISNLAEEIAEKISNDYNNYGEITVLARTGKELAEIAVELEKFDIPYILENRSSILENPVIKSIYSFLKFSFSKDIFEFLKYIRSDLAGLKQQEMRIIFDNLDQIRTLFYQNKDGKELSIENEKIKSLFTEIKNIINSDYNQILFYLYQQLKSNYKLIDNPVTLKNIYSFYDILNSFSSRRDLLNYLENNKDNEELKQEKVKSSSAVNLMTIHKAKGLSMPVEFFYWKPGKRGKSQKSKLEFFIDFDAHFSGVDRYLFTKGDYLKILDWLDFDFKSKQEKKELMEEINNVYVALTRAEKDLNIYIETPRKLIPYEDLMWKGSSYDFYEKAIINSAQTEKLVDLITYSSSGEKEESEKDSTDKKIILPDMSGYFLENKESPKTFSSSFKDKDRLELAKNRIRGLAVHFYLENIYYGESEEKKEAKNLLTAKFVNIVGQSAINKITSEADKFIKENPELFSKKWTVYTEYLLKNGDKSFRIDRLLVDKKNQHIRIIDFKSGYYRKKDQLIKYKSLIKELVGVEWKIDAEFVDI